MKFLYIGMLGSPLYSYSHTSYLTLEFSNFHSHFINDYILFLAHKAPCRWGLNVDLNDNEDVKILYYL